MFWQKNPLTVVGDLDRCWLFTYRIPGEQARTLLPQPLELVTYKGYAFWNIVVSHIRAMRPKHFPAFVGVSYWHLAYRLYARLPLASGQAIEGLYFLRSDCDQPLMTLAGNLLTDFHFHTTTLQVHRNPEALEIQVRSPDAPAFARLCLTQAPQHDPHSIFPSQDEAAAFLKYKPYGLSLSKAGLANVVHITRNELAWQSRLVAVETAGWAFLHKYDVHPEICYEVDPIRYQWDRGRLLTPLSDQL
ncbi:MAG TPA: DUF2071 domain-containing protein [Ktedonobacteraceae bacterium]|nr:DUF2071 domain-containing protein [Ktedonobacteraceae bacterium]